jgi:sulfate adenylyltransferase
MRYAGPKAALFLAIVRKNFGCSHYIVGHDQAGVARYYDPYDCHRIFDEYPVGIVPLRYRESFFCRRCHEMASAKTCPHPESTHAVTSQTRIRRAILDGSQLPADLLRPEVIALLSAGRGVLIDEAPHPSSMTGEGRESARVGPTRTGSTS